MLKNSLPKYYEKVLENGLKIVAIPLDNGSNVISTDIFYNVGSRDEIMGKSGIAHMLEHLNFKSTKNLKAGEFDTIVKGFGGINNASTGFDYTHYYIKSSTKNMSKSLELYADLMENLTLKDEEFQTERNVVAEERPRFHRLTEAALVRPEGRRCAAGHGRPVGGPDRRGGFRAADLHDPDGGGERRPGSDPPPDACAAATRRLCRVAGSVDL